MHLHLPLPAFPAFTAPVLLRPASAQPGLRLHRPLLQRRPLSATLSPERPTHRKVRLSRRRSRRASGVVEYPYRGHVGKDRTHPSALRRRTTVHVCSVCVRYDDLLLRDVPYDDLPLNLRMKLHFERYTGTSWVLIVVADLLADLCVANIAHGVDGPADMAGVAAGFFAAYVFADLVSGVANWFTFTFLSNGERACYCDGMRDFSRRVGINCAVVLPFLSLLLLHAPHDAMTYSFSVYFLSFVSVIPALVDWSGSTSFPPSASRVLRRIGAHVRPVHSAQFLNMAWHNILFEGRILSRLEKWIYLGSRGTLVPKNWHLDPQARVKAFGCDLDPFRRRSEQEVMVQRVGIEETEESEFKSSESCTGKDFRL